MAAPRGPEGEVRIKLWRSDGERLGSRARQAGPTPLRNPPGCCALRLQRTGSRARQAGPTRLRNPPGRGSDRAQTKRQVRVAGGGGCRARMATGRPRTGRPRRKAARTKRAGEAPLWAAAQTEPRRSGRCGWLEEGVAEPGWRQAGPGRAAPDGRPPAPNAQAKRRCGPRSSYLELVDDLTGELAAVGVHLPVVGRPAGQESVKIGAGHRV